MSKKNQALINDDISAENVMLINQDGDKQGIVSIKEAIKLAETAEMDLVQVSPKGADPIVCKILDYGKCTK